MWTAVSCAREAQEWATKVTSANDVFRTSGFRVAARSCQTYMDRILGANITLINKSNENFPINANENFPKMINVTSLVNVVAIFNVELILTQQ